jgi:hypothetical protein
MKVKLLDLPITRCDPTKGVKCFELMAPFRFTIDRDMIEVPSGFWTDWASVGLAASIISPTDPSICRGALGHDFLYFMGYVNKHVCDDFIAEAMRIDNAPLWKRLIVRFGLWIGGWSVWESYRHNNKSYLLRTSFNSLKAGEALSKITVSNWKR